MKHGLIKNINIEIWGVFRADGIAVFAFFSVGNSVIFLKLGGILAIREISGERFQ